MNAKGIIFDLDGTLLDTLGDIADSANKVLEQRGYPTHPTHMYKIFVGNGVYTLFEEAAPEGVSSQDLKACCHEFGEIYKDNWRVKSCPYPQINALLQQLKDQEVKLAVLSNKPDKFTRMYVENFWEEGMFDFYFGQRETIARKPDPAGVFELAELMGLDLDHLIYVGDSSIDMQTGKNAGVFTVGVSWGFRTVEELKANKADVIINEPMELIKYAGSN